MPDKIGIPTEDGFCCLNADWRFTFLNRVTLEILKRKSEELIEKVVWDEYPHLAGTAFEQVCRSVMEKHFAQRIEMQSQQSGYWYHIVVFPSQGGVAIYWRDTTAEKHAQERLETLVEMLQQADENRNNFIKILSHELRNPLASITIGLTLMKNAAPGSGQAEKAIGIMERQTKQLSRLVDDLLDVTRIAQNKIDLQKEQIDLNEIVSLTVTDYQSHFKDKGVNLEFERHPNPVRIDADPARITQAIGNLIHNAAKFTNKGDSVWVMVKADHEKEQALITVQDTGYGIDPSIMLHLFEPFVQADSSLAHSCGGLGLGLPIVRGITELHGGCVSVVSDGVGKGARFTMRLPLSTGQPLPERVNVAGIMEQGSRPLNILIIEDIPDLAEILSDLLTHLGHRVTTALNGLEGISMAKHHRPDVLISDIGLPGMSGYEIAEAFRSDDQLKGVFLIALSGYAQPEDFERSRKAGFSRHLAKPVSLESLKAALDAVKKDLSADGNDKIQAGLHVGIDGCEGKWIAVAITDHSFEAGKFDTIKDICTKYDNAETMIIDIPIGLPESMSDVRPDKSVRKQLGRKGSSIFDTPCRQAVYAESKEAARENNIRTLGKSLSEQSIAISKAIRQVDEFLNSNPEWKNRLLESHPEYCFMMFNHGRPVLEKKTEETGQAIRLEILRKYYPKTDKVVEKFLFDTQYKKKLDDLIDAMCLAVVGKLAAKDGLRSVPEQPMADSKGLWMQIVYNKGIES